ncbi:MAG: response regulator [Chitinophagaceae bacterium]|nr:response regulator [Chitinophagaceae bacterium]
METAAHLKIFVVDDDLFSLNMYQQHLSNLGFENVKTFDNGTACLLCLTEQPDIIFLDHGMDILNGVEVLKKIKRFNPDIYVVFISGQADVLTAVNSLKFGAFDYIKKGEDDLRMIEKVMEKIQEIMVLMQKKKKGLLKKLFTA